jgi:hypothetical protein|uniref:Uncharacterized protein n=1 Tax=Eutreptiella gymnastica TaxID=73025 RepID=A0A7S4GH79_9EUGL
MAALRTMAIMWVAINLIQLAAYGIILHLIGFIDLEAHLGIEIGEAEEAEQGSFSVDLVAIALMLVSLLNEGAKILGFQRNLKANDVGGGKRVIALLFQVVTLLAAEVSCLVIIFNTAGLDTLKDCVAVLFINDTDDYMSEAIIDNLERQKVHPDSQA